MPAAALAAITLLGCATLFGIEDRPLVADASEAPSPGDAGDACPSTGSRWCETLCPRPDFCEDFDEQGPETRWNGGSLNSGGSLSVESDEAAGALGTALFARVSASYDAGQPPDDIGAVAALVHALPPSDARGLRATIRVRFLELGFEPVPFDSGTLPGPSAVILGILNRGGEALGATAWHDPRKGPMLGIVLRRSAKGESRPLVDFELTPTTLGAIAGRYSDIEVAFGPPAVLTRYGFPCSQVSASVPFALHTTLFLSACKGVPELAESPSWLTAPTLSVGAILTGTGKFAVAVDGVAFYFLR